MNNVFFYHLLAFNQNASKRKYKHIVPPTLNTLNNSFINQEIILDLNKVWIFLKDFPKTTSWDLESWIYFKMFASWPKPYKVKIFYQKVLKCFLVECFLMCRCRHTSSRFLTQLIGTCFQVRELRLLVKMLDMFCITYRVKFGKINIRQNKHFREKLR